MADKRPKGPPPRFIENLGASPFNPTSDPNWYAGTLAADVKRGSFAEKLSQVQFFFDKEKFQTAQATDSNGRATVNGEFPKGNHEIGALILGEPISKMVTTKVFVGEVPEEKKEEKQPLRASRVHVTESDLDGDKKLLTFETLSDEFVRVPGVKLRIQERSLPDGFSVSGSKAKTRSQKKGFVDVKTDKTGTKSVEFVVKDARMLRVIPLGEPAKSFDWPLYPKNPPVPKNSNNTATTTSTALTIREDSNG